MIIIKAVIAEFIGTFFFFSIILNAIANASLGPVAVAIGLLAAIYFGGSISGGHFNPAVSVMMFAKGNITSEVLVLYIIAQVLAGLAAVGINSYFIS